MAGRLIGEALWTSKKIASLPPEAKAEYAWMYQIAEYNGVFELDVRAIHVKCYAYARPEVTIVHVEKFLADFEAAGLLLVWEQDGKRWGWWTGSDKPGRMPRASWRDRYRKRGTLPPEPPADRLTASAAQQPSADGTDAACQRHASAVAPPRPRTELNRTELKVKPLSDAFAPDEKRQSPPKVQPSNAASRLVSLLKAEILRNKPDYRITPAQERKWTATADRMLRLDGRTEEAVAEIIRWAQHDEFWRANVLSMDTVRQKFDQLEMKRGTVVPKPSPRQPLGAKDYTAGTQGFASGAAQ